MASNIPTQSRVIDPFASYNSNAVNELTQVVSQGENGILTPSSLQVTIDSTLPNTVVNVSTGFAIMDDVLIQISQEHAVDFTDADHYYSSASVLPQEGGYHYVVLDYIYEKSKPAPTASIKILKPSEISLLDTESNLLLLKVVQLNVASPHAISTLYDYDPDNTDNQRKCINYYAGSVGTLPTFDLERDLGRLLFVEDRNDFYFGYLTGWEQVMATGGLSLDIVVDDVTIEEGFLCFNNADGEAEAAVSSSIDTCADYIVLNTGTSTVTGKGLLSGFASNVPIETGIVIERGNVIYLSAIQAGRITNVRPSGVYQVVGRALTSGNHVTPIDIIFSPKLPLNLSLRGQISTWFDTTGEVTFHTDINISSLESTGVFLTAFFNNLDLTKYTPEEVQILDDGDTLRVVVDDNTLVLNFIVSVGGGSTEGGEETGGTTNHALLTNLAFADSGHTGFAPTPHNNTHHSDTYITAALVNFTTLFNNASVGTGGTQVAYGNHTHANLVDIPSNTTLLFESDTAISGYTLLETQDDMVVYITKGSAGGGESGGGLKSGGTWSQPNHNHTVSGDGYHRHATLNHTLTIAQIPAHTHAYTTYSGLYQGPTPGGATPVFPVTGSTGSTGGSQAHNHGWTDHNDSYHDHGGATGNSATLNTWRPRGLNYTRQQRV